MADTITRKFLVTLTREAHWNTTIAARTEREAIELAEQMTPPDDVPNEQYHFGQWDGTTQVQMIDAGPVSWAVRSGLADNQIVPRPGEPGRFDVTDSEQANAMFGCHLDDWCILPGGHPGLCCSDRETDLAGGQPRPASLDHGVLFSICTAQGTAMPESTLCWQHARIGLRDAMRAALAAGDAAASFDWYDSTRNTEVECIVCGCRGSH